VVVGHLHDVMLGVVETRWLMEGIAENLGILVPDRAKPTFYCV